MEEYGYYQNGVILPSLKGGNNHKVEYHDVHILNVDTAKSTVYMGTRVNTLGVYLKCDYAPYLKEQCFAFDIGINTFKNSLYDQLITSAFYNGDMPDEDFEPTQLVGRDVRVIIGRENGIHLLGFLPFSRHFVRSR